MLLVYLFQSLYVQSWLLVIFILNSQRGEKGIKITFFTIDSICILLMLVTVIFRIFVKDPDSTDPNKTAYAVFNDLGIQFIAVSSMVVSLIYAIMGGIIVVQLR